MTDEYDEDPTPSHHDLPGIDVTAGGQRTCAASLRAHPPDFGPLVRILLAVHDGDYEQPIPRAVQLMRVAEAHGLLTRAPSMAGTRNEPRRPRKHPAKLTRKGLAYLYATGALEPNQPVTDQHVGYLQTSLVVLSKPT